MNESEKHLLVREIVLHKCTSLLDYNQSSGHLAQQKYGLSGSEIKEVIDEYRPITCSPQEASPSWKETRIRIGETMELFREEYLKYCGDYGPCSFEEFVSRADMNVIEKIGKRGIDYDFAQATLDHLRDTMGFQTAREVAHACIMTGASNYREFEERASAFAGKSWNTTVQQVCTMFDDMREYQQLCDEYETVQGLIQKRTRGAEDLVTFRNHIIDKIYKLDDYYQFSDAFEERDFVAAVNETSKYTVNETPKQNLFHKVVSMWQNI